MLPAGSRLRRPSDFAAAVRRGPGTVRAARGTVVAHLLLPLAADDAAAEQSRDAISDLAPAARAGFIVSKAVGSAVVRNAVRRRLRHLVRDRLVDLPAGSRLVVRAMPSAAKVPFDVLERDLAAALADVVGRGRR